jgi:hypothetical protein
LWGFKKTYYMTVFDIKKNCPFTISYKFLIINLDPLIRIGSVLYSAKYLAMDPDPKDRRKHTLTVYIESGAFLSESDITES